MKKIPTEITLLGSVIKVKQLPYDALQKVYREEAKLHTASGDVPNVLGLFSYNRLTLYVVAKDLARFSEEFRLSVFHHELAHGLLHMAGRPELSSDETLVDILGNLIMQADKTAVYA